MGAFSNLFGKSSAGERRLKEEIALLRRSPLLDPVWYRETYPDLGAAPIDVARHYLLHGAAEGRNPHPLFDTRFYLQQYPDVAATGANPLVHYLCFGVREGRSPNPHADMKSYLKQHPTADISEIVDMLVSHAASGKSGAQSEARHDAGSVKAAAPEVRSIELDSDQGQRGAARDVDSRHEPASPPDPVAASSGLFDAEWYLDQNPDVKASGGDPWEHFNLFGWRESRNPNPLFDVAWYLERYPDVKRAEVNPLDHYAAHGWREGRDPGPGFSVDYYLERNEDLRAAGVEPLEHYLRHGKAEGRPARRCVQGNYQSFVDATVWNVRRESALVNALSAVKHRLPKISVLMPVYETEEVWLVRAIESVRSQLYEDLELCVSDNASPSPHVRKVLDFYCALDPRIKVYYRSENGHICRNTNDAFALSTGEVVVLFDSDDELPWDSFAEIALAFAEDPQVDYVYTDCDKIDEQGRRFDPHFKPDWSPELLLTYMYAGQCLAVRREIWASLGGLRIGYEGSQDHDFALRATEIVRKVAHVPRVLYHWRSHRNSTASATEGGGQKPYSFEAGRRAVQDALQRRGVEGKAQRPEFAVKGGNSFFEIDFPDHGPKVSIIIPTHNKTEMLAKCLKSLKLTTYKDYEIVIIGNDWIQSEVEPALKSFGHKVLWAPPGPKGGFNFSHKMNWASRRVDGELILLLNDDTEVVNPTWLSSMVGYSRLPGVGVVGALLRFPDGRVQHAGILSGLEGGKCGHTFRFAPPNDRGYCSLISAARNCSGVTAACLLVPRKLYHDVGGFNETEFGVAYNDPDFCYRVYDAGYRIVYTPNAELLHYEGATRGFGDDPDEEAAYLDRYSERRDPYYNANFSTSDENFRFQPTNLPQLAAQKATAAFVSHNLNWEGAPRHLVNLVMSLKETGAIEPIVFSLRDGPLREVLAAAGIVVRFLPQSPGWKCPAKVYENWATKIQDELAIYRPQTVFANTFECFFAVDAAAAAGITSLWNIHESEGERYFDRWSADLRSIALSCFSKAYRLIYVSDATRALYAMLDENNVSITIKNGYLPPLGSKIDRASARQQLGLSPESVVFLCVGTVCERKAQLDIVAAVANGGIPNSALDRFQLLIVGDRKSDYSDRLHQAAADLPDNLRRRVRIVPETREASMYFSAADVFICASRIESYPVVVMEAMGAGLAIITTPVFGISEQVRPNRNALLYAPGDCARLHAHICHLLQDDQTREAFGRFSLRQLRTLPSSRTMINDYKKVILQATTASNFRVGTHAYKFCQNIGFA